MNMHDYSGNPFLVFGPRPRRALRIRAYIIRQHRAGRRLTEILDDPYLQRYAGWSLVWSTLLSPETLHALRNDTQHELDRLAGERQSLSAG